MEAQVHPNKPKLQSWLRKLRGNPMMFSHSMADATGALPHTVCICYEFKRHFFPLQMSLMFQHWYKLAIFGRLSLNKPACLHQCMGKQPVGFSVLHRPSDDVNHLNFCVRICTVSITTTILQQTGSCKTSTKCNFPLPTVISWKLLTFFNNFLNEYFFWRFLKFIKLPLFCWQCWVSSNRVLSYLTAQNITLIT